MNTRNVNVKTATKAHSKRYGQTPVSPNIELMLTLASYEGILMSIAAELRLGLMKTQEELYLGQRSYEGICEDVLDMLDREQLCTDIHWAMLKSVSDIAVTLPWKGWQEEVLRIFNPDGRIECPDEHIESPELTCEYETLDDQEHLDALYGYLSACRVIGE
ncbi:hypothetical protein [Serratia marcescens]|uniref:hypothetical protein n=1 Tax=Serratia marcescens TaxID=615 RepID=UPI0024A632D4|nr:hypothetical protein [Serratia marcescens]